MKTVERERWKYVISTSFALKRYPGVMKIDVSPDHGAIMPSSCAALSSSRSRSEERRVGEEVRFRRWGFQLEQSRAFLSVSGSRNLNDSYIVFFFLHGRLRSL